jgi:UDP-glucose 4-epimerase
VHVDDLVAALELVVLDDHPGTFNVASDGWLDPAAVHALVAPPRVPAVSHEVAERLLRLTWQLGIGDVPPGVLPYLEHPWVIANDQLRALGWAPRHGNEEAIVDGLASLRRPTSGRVVLALAAGGVAGAAVTAWRLRRARRDGRRSTRPTPA